MRVFTTAVRRPGSPRRAASPSPSPVPLSEVHRPAEQARPRPRSSSPASASLGAGAAGLAVARAGLRPVDRLTDAVEHVARTEDLTVRIPVEGDDEIARLSRSFNSMTAALATSRDCQQQLIADAGHELRTPLTSLRTNIELLARSEETGRALPPADRKALLASVKAQMTELAALIGDLQELSRPGRGPAAGRSRWSRCTRRVEAALRAGPAARPGADASTRSTRALVRTGGAGRAGAGDGQPARQRGEVQPVGRRRRGRAQQAAS